MKTEQEATIFFTLYEGKIKGKFLGPTEDKPDRHMYFIGGERKTGVTTYLGIKDKSRALISWAVGLAIDYLREKRTITEVELIEASIQHTIRKKKAADVGSKAHDWIELWIKHSLKQGPKPEMPDDDSVLIATNAFIDWVKGQKVKFVSSERVVYSKKYDYLGTLDIEAEIGGKLYLIDIKTGNDLYNEVRAQTAAYVMADQEESKRKYEGRWAIRLSKETKEEYEARMAKKGKTEYKPYQAFEAKYFDKESLKEDFEAFLAAMTLYRWDRKTDFYQQSKNEK